MIFGKATAAKFSRNGQKRPNKFEKIQATLK